MIERAPELMLLTHLPLLLRSMNTALELHCQQPWALSWGKANDLRAQSTPVSPCVQSERTANAE
ncbi:UNVERIFIED_CONTAM: hypothetical protein FKN15_030990 [Acipenser sinensis]